MTRAEVDLAVEWAAAEGWNPGLHDADAFHAADADGFLVGLLDDEPVAAISVVRYRDAFAFLGFYIVRPEHRGAGYGIRIWREGMARLEGCNVGLDGVVEQQGNYRQSGFAYAYGNRRYEGVGGSEAPSGVIPATSASLDDVLAYDRLCFPAPRPDFLRVWLAQSESAAFVAPGSSGLRGYGVIRRCRRGHKIGPLFADDPETADALFRALSTTVTGETLYLDVPLVNEPAVALALRYGMQPVFETARMYTAGKPELDIARVFGVTTFELG